MFCTPKERETCDVEKMTCEGCYYNKDGDYMNEEEIIKDLLKQSQEDVEIWKDLYNQEKEKNKKLEEELKSCFKDDYIKRHELNTVIHIMADDMMNGIIPRFKNSIELKEYYFKKARGEEDEKS